MLRGFLLTLVFSLLALQVISSLFETGLYAAEKIYFDQNDLTYTKGWLYYFKWVVKCLSLGVALVLLVGSLCSCCCGGPKNSGSGGRRFPRALGFFSLILTALWAVVVAFQVRNNDKTNVTSIISTSIQAQKFVYPLGDGFSLKNDCSAYPFTSIDHGTTACKLLLAESAVAIACLGLWALTLIFSFFLCCTVSRTQKKNVQQVAWAQPQQHY
ncbi:hypothetical protein EC988_001448 [Linderina pennispora]|nr:hypothetical protein EC988_001448 [Linderina pennispora]